MKQSNIDYRKLAEYKGQSLTAKEILKICGYSPKTGIHDCMLVRKKIITPVFGTYPRRWLVSEHILDELNNI